MSEILRVKVEYSNRQITKISVLVDDSKKSEAKLSHLQTFTANYKEQCPCYLRIQPYAELSDNLIKDVVLFGLKSDDVASEFPEFQKPNF